MEIIAPYIFPPFFILLAMYLLLSLRGAIATWQSTGALGSVGENIFPFFCKGGLGRVDLLFTRQSLAVFALIFLFTFTTTAQAYVFRPDVDDNWPASTQDYFFYVHTDHLGSSNLLTEGAEKTTHGGLRYTKGQVVQRIEYTPFGKERYVLNPSLEELPKYTGQTNDIDTDLYYYGSRYYDPVLGRFIQPDSIIPDVYQSQTLNPYSYVLNNPLKYTDPTGHEREEVDRHENVGGYSGSVDPSDYDFGPSDQDIHEIFSVDGTVNDVAGTWDPLTDSRISELDPRLQDRVTAFINNVDTQLDVKLRVSEGYRSFQMQDDLYSQGRTKPGDIVTNAKGGESYHNYGLAFDVVEVKNGKTNYDLDWDKIVPFAKEQDFKWGGDWEKFKDKPHFQDDFGSSIAELREKYEKEKR